MGSDRWYSYMDSLRLFVGTLRFLTVLHLNRKKVQLHNYLAADEAWNWAILQRLSVVWKDVQRCMTFGILAHSSHSRFLLFYYYVQYVLITWPGTTKATLLRAMDVRSGSGGWDATPLGLTASQKHVKGTVRPLSKDIWDEGACFAVHGCYHKRFPLLPQVPNAARTPGETGSFECFHGRWGDGIGWRVRPGISRLKKSLNTVYSTCINGMCLSLWHCGWN